MMHFIFVGHHSWIFLSCG